MVRTPLLCQAHRAHQWWWTNKLVVTRQITPPLLGCAILTMLNSKLPFLEKEWLTFVILIPKTTFRNLFILSQHLDWILDKLCEIYQSAHAVLLILWRGGLSPWGPRPRIETVRPDAEIINADHPRYQFHRFILKFSPTLKFILTALWKWGRSNPKNSNSWQLIVGHLLLRFNFCLFGWNFVPAHIMGACLTHCRLWYTLHI